MNDQPSLRPKAMPPATCGAEVPTPGSGDLEPPEPRSMLAVDIVGDEADWSAFGCPETAIFAAAAALAGHPGLITSSVEAVVALSCDAEVARLNGTYRNQPQPTNVLSFPAAPPPPSQRPTTGEPRPLGDIILARETLLNEAATLGIPPAHHLQHLVIHGLLHLLGHDHQTEPEAAVMESIETIVLAALGIPDPYSGAQVAIAQFPCAVQ